MAIPTETYAIIGLVLGVIGFIIYTLYAYSNHDKEDHEDVTHVWVEYLRSKEKSFFDDAVFAGVSMILYLIFWGLAVILFMIVWPLVVLVITLGTVIFITKRLL